MRAAASCGARAGADSSELAGTSGLRGGVGASTGKSVLGLGDVLVRGSGAVAGSTDGAGAMGLSPRACRACVGAGAGASVSAPGVSGLTAGDAGTGCIGASSACAVGAAAGLVGPVPEAGTTGSSAGVAVDRLAPGEGGNSSDLSSP